MKKIKNIYKLVRFVMSSRDFICIPTDPRNKEELTASVNTAHALLKMLEDMENKNRSRVDNIESGWNSSGTDLKDVVKTGGFHITEVSSV